MLPGSHCQAQMPADPEPPLGTAQRVQWLGWLPGTLSSFWGQGCDEAEVCTLWLQEGCQGMHPCPEILQQPAARGGLRGEGNGLLWMGKGSLRN